jgi:hypothetical protein
VRVALAEGIQQRERGIVLRVVHAVNLTSESQWGRRRGLSGASYRVEGKSLCGLYFLVPYAEGDVTQVTCDACAAALVAASGDA